MSTDAAPVPIAAPPQTVDLACPLPIEHAGVVVARVGDTVLTACDVAVAWEERTREGYVVDDLSAVLRGLVDEALLVSTVQRQPHDRAVDRVLAEALIRADALAALAHEQPDEATIQRFYVTHHDDFTMPERVHLREVVLPTRATAEAIGRQLAAGAPFDALVTSTIDTAGRRDGGDLGWLPHSGAAGVAPAIVEAGFALAEPGAIAPVPLQVVTLVPGRRRPRAVSAWHVVQLLQRLPAEEIPIESARRRIVHRLTRERYVALRREARTRWTATLANAVHAAVDEHALHKVTIAPR